MQSTPSNSTASTPDKVAGEAKWITVRSLTEPGNRIIYEGPDYRDEFNHRGRAWKREPGKSYLPPGLKGRVRHNGGWRTQ